MAPKGKGKGKGAELVFDDKARAEYLTGFRKRKQERKQAGRDYLAKKAKEEQLVARKELRDARKEKAAENVREQRKAFGLEAEGESDLDGAAGSDDGELEDDAAPQIQEEEYDSDEHHTHVVVEAFDPEQEAFDKAVASTSTASPARKPKVNGASSTAASPGVETLPPSSRRVNKAKANASLSPPPPPPCLGELLFQCPSTSTELTSSHSASALTGQGEEAHHPHQEEDVAQKRLHISGLTSAFSKEDLMRRFSTFGNVVALDGLGKRDALGQFRPYAYLTLQAPPQQIKRCMNLLSGSVWKGATLRIGEAKPDYQQRVELEKEKRRQEEEERASRKKPKRLPPGMGVESSNMEPVDEAAVENGLAWGWKRTPAGHLVRPLRMRPAHPLPKPSRASTLASVNATQEEEDEAPSSSRPPRVNPRVPSKAHRITIDPTRYGAVHLSGPLLESLAAETGASTDAFDVTSLGPGEWHCEEIEDDEVESASTKDHRLVRWQYTAKDGKILHEEFTKIPIRVVAASSATASNEEDVMAQLDFDQYSDAGSDDLFSGFTSSIAPAKPQIESKAPKNAPRDAVVDSADIDDLFADLPASSVQATSIDDLFSDLPFAPTPAKQLKRAKVDKVVSTPTPSKVKGSFVPGLDPEEAEFSDGYDEVVAAGAAQSKQVVNAAEERQKTLALLGQMFGSGSDDEVSQVDVADLRDEDVEEEESDSVSSEEADSESESDAGVVEADAVEESSSSSSSSSSEDSEDSESDEAESPIAESAPEAQRVGIVDSQPDEQPDEQMEVASAPASEASAPAIDAKSRRAAFLSSLSAPSSASATGSFVPIARFDPGTRTAPAIDETPTIPPAEEAPSAPTPVLPAAAPEGTRVSMSTLKQMFRPQEPTVDTGFSFGLGADDNGDAGAGFSLMDSLGLEFELEDEPEVEEPLPRGTSGWGAHRIQQPPTSVSMQEQEVRPKKHAHFFPSSSTDAWNGADSQGSVQRWLKPRSEEERERDWARYKETLTAVVKKRHREAARKHKRGFRSQPRQEQGKVDGRV
ncbi:Nucleolar protein 12 [Kalmanozyma brasiliensis GHG001]|uniref:Nucleolar protein 12 n=1 Tax=Kalmanozyma brasiliensis (strain GHG001) TaxID=1365824 RepID=UPI001CEB0C7B|nr:Nucleolar protein 12 [Kalmanozyma brasiliensis GHG001]EST08256.2 Nucleolar protein 12 [Kalmanozyma brasiliensis GHG001]